MPLRMTNGDKLTFESLDGITGYFSTDRENYINDLVQLQTLRRGGVFAISQEEYERDFSKKKADSTLFDFRSVHREEIGPDKAPDTLLPRIPPPAPPEPPAAAVKPAEPTGPKGPVRGANIGRRPV